MGQPEHGATPPGLRPWPGARRAPRTHQRRADHGLDHRVEHLLGQTQQSGAAVHDGLVRVVLGEGGEKAREGRGAGPGAPRPRTALARVSWGSRGACFVPTGHSVFPESGTKGL